MVSVSHRINIHIKNSGAHGNHSSNYTQYYNDVHKYGNIVNRPVLAENHFDKPKVLEEKEDERVGGDGCREPSQVESTQFPVS